MGQIAITKRQWGFILPLIRKGENYYLVSLEVLGGRSESNGLYHDVSISSRKALLDSKDLLSIDGL